jgi:NTE family protein
MHRLNDIQQLTAYAGGSLEMGNVWKNTSDIFSHDNIFGGSLFVGADTPLGPLYLAYGRNDSGEGSVYLYLGPLFSF